MRHLHGRVGQKAMKQTGRYDGTLRYLYARLPIYATLYGGAVLLLPAMGLAASQGWWGFVPLLLALLLVLLYFVLASLWAAHRIYDTNGRQAHHILFEMGQFRETDRFAFVELDGRWQAIELGRRLSTGQVVVIDVYNPQVAPSRTLARSRANQPRPPAGDPRFVWRNGDIDLLPLPDESVTAVVLCETLAHFWQKGDQETLLQEARRILVPGGRLLLAERTRTRANWLHLGPAALTLSSSQSWRELLQQRGFILRREVDIGGLIHCFRADKPIPIEAQQLRLAL